VAAPALEAQPAVEASPAPEAVAAEPAVAAVPVAAAEPAPQAVEATPATGTDLSFAPTYFATGSATLSPNGRSLISEIAKTVERLDEIVLLEVRGYADARGARNWNRSLARKRAEAVKAALVEEGIAVWRIRAVAVGETEPVQGQVWRGRRVEIVELE
jgi:outer membrane protein OmpA-like peptidoglycan-associated protein